MERVEEFTAVHDWRIVIEDHEINRICFDIGQSLRSVFEEMFYTEVGTDFDILFIDGGDHRIVLNDDYMVHDGFSFPVNVMVKQVPSPSSVSMEISPCDSSTSCLIRKSPVPRFSPLDETPRS